MQKVKNKREIENTLIVFFKILRDVLVLHKFVFDAEGLITLVLNNVL